MSINNEIEEFGKSIGASEKEIQDAKDWLEQHKDDVEPVIEVDKE